MALEKDRKAVAKASGSSRNGAWPPPRLLAGILKIERLCDAIAEGEFAACDISTHAARAEVIDAVRAVVLRK